MYKVKNPELFKADVSQIEDSDCAARVRFVVVPSCLMSRKLVVGDEEQCKALKEYNKQIEEIIDEYKEDKLK